MSWQVVHDHDVVRANQDERKEPSGRLPKREARVGIGRAESRHGAALGFYDQIEVEPYRHAVDAGVDRTYISGIERGAFNPTIDLLERLAQALSIDIVTLLAIPDPAAPQPIPLKVGRRSAK